MIVDLRSKIVFQAREGDSEFTLPAPFHGEVQPKDLLNARPP